MGTCLNLMSKENKYTPFFYRRPTKILPEVMLDTPSVRGSCMQLHQIFVSKYDVNITLMKLMRQWDKHTPMGCLPPYLFSITSKETTIMLPSEAIYRAIYGNIGETTFLAAFLRRLFMNGDTNPTKIPGWPMIYSRKIPGLNSWCTQEKVVSRYKYQATSNAHNITSNRTSKPT